MYIFIQVQVGYVHLAWAIEPYWRELVELHVISQSWVLFLSKLTHTWKGPYPHGDGLGLARPEVYILHESILNQIWWAELQVCLSGSYILYQSTSEAQNRCHEWKSNSNKFLTSWIMSRDRVLVFNKLNHESKTEFMMFPYVLPTIAHDVKQTLFSLIGKIVIRWTCHLQNPESFSTNFLL